MRSIIILLAIILAGCVHLDEPTPEPTELRELPSEVMDECFCFATRIERQLSETEFYYVPGTETWFLDCGAEIQELNSFDECPDEDVYVGL